MKMSRWFSFAALVAVFSLSTVAIAGDKQDDKELFDKVCGKLDKGGSYFNFQSSKYIFLAVEQTYLHIPEAIKVIVPEQQNQIMPLIVYNCLKPVVKSFGIDEMLAIGSSSVIIAEKTEKEPNLFQSKQFIYHGGKKVSGIIWDFAAGENQPLNMNSLPKETLFACSSQVVPARVWGKIKLVFAKLPFPPAQTIPMLAEQNFFNNYNVKLDDFLESISGNYSTLIMSAKSVDGKPALYAMLKIPNKKDMAFKVLSQMAKSEPDIQVLPDNISLKTEPALNWLKPAVRKEGENIYIVSNPQVLEVVKKTAASKDGLVATPEFKHLSQKISQNGIAFFYFNSKTIINIIDIVKANIDQENKDWSVFAKMIPPSDFFMVVNKEEDGIMFTMNSPMDIPQLIAYSSVMPSILQVVQLLPALNSSRVRARQISCSSNLKQIGLSLKMYAMDHADKYPEADNAAGLNELIKEDYLTDLAVYVCPNSKTTKAAGKELKEANSSYIYIGGFNEGDGADIPMAFDKFDNNRSIINILYQDGHVATLSAKFSNCKELINYLAKNNSYSPEILKKLQGKAAKIDKEMGYK